MGRVGPGGAGLGEEGGGGDAGEGVTRRGAGFLSFFIFFFTFIKISFDFLLVFHNHGCERG